MIILDILNEFQKGHTDINTIHNQVNICYGSVCFTALVLEGFLVYVIFSNLKRFLIYNFQISILLNGHADLIDKFTRFLPKTEPVSAEKWYASKSISFSILSLLPMLIVLISQSWTMTKQ